MDIATLMESAELVFCKPVAPVKLQWLRSLRLVPNSPPKGPFKDLVLRKFNKLLDNTADDILIGRVFFIMLLKMQQEKKSITTKHMCSQVLSLCQTPSVTSTPILSKYTGLVQTTVTSLSRTSNSCNTYPSTPPHSQFHSWDALNPNPSSVFSPQAYGNGLLLFPLLSSFVDIIEVADVSEGKPAAPKKLKSSKELDRTRKGSRRFPSPP